MSESHKPVSYQPTDGLTYDPTDEKYWSPEALGQEITRAFEICHGCRMCFKYCDTFPLLFETIDDEAHDGDVRQITAAETDAILDTCFQCKLCEVQCPYTPRDQHEFQLDFPKLVHRHQAQRTKRQGLRLRDRVLGNPDGTGKMARASLGLANAMNRVRAHRWFLEKMLDIDRRKQLPDFARRTFEKWAKKTGRIDKDAPPGGDAVLFQTCYVQHNEPEIGRDTVEVMEANGVDLRCAKGFRCCGMPAWERGDLKRLRKYAKKNLDLLEPYVDAGAKVLAINPTCSMMLRREYPELVAPEDRERAQKVAEAVQDPGEYLWERRQSPQFNSAIKSRPDCDTIAYHTPCHLRTQGKGFKGRDLVRKLLGVQVTTTMECCGHDGTWAMTTAGFEPSQRVGKKAFDGMKGPDTWLWATDCPLAAIQFEQHAGVKPMHPMSILARAYREQGFGERTRATEATTDTDQTQDPTPDGGKE